MPGMERRSGAVARNAIADARTGSQQPAVEIVLATKPCAAPEPSTDPLIRHA